MGPLGHCLLTLPHLLIHPPQLLGFLVVFFFPPALFRSKCWCCKGENSAERKDAGLTQVPPHPSPFQSPNGSCPLSSGVSFSVRDISGFVRWL